MIYTGNVKLSFTSALRPVSALGRGLIAAIAIGLALPLLPLAAHAESALAVAGGPNSMGKTLNETYDMAALKAMPVTKIETNTSWTEGVQTFEGVELKTLLDKWSVSSGTLIAEAADGYRIEIPVAEIEAGGPMLAYMMNGAPMALDDKGPFWIVYPYDSDPKFQTEDVLSRSIWQLTRMEIAP